MGCRPGLPGAARMTPSGELRIEAGPVTDFARLGETWRALEAEAEPAFFRSWTWVGCLVEERFPDPVLLRAVRGERLVGLALFNRRRGRLCLGESGDARLDAPFVEHNGPLVAGDAEIPHRAWADAAWRVRGARRLVLSGVEPALADAAGAVLRRQERIAPFIDLEALRRGGGEYLASLSANTRQQIRRSMRAYEAAGPLELARAAGQAEAEAWLDALIALHDADWRARGKPGAFADPFMLRFHRALVPRALAREELDLLRITAGARVVGFLYNLEAGGVVHAYQSGMDRAGAGSHGKPGLTCHALAVARALEEGRRSYDLMAGSQRYKSSLAQDATTLAWSTTVRCGSVVAATAAGLRWIKRRWRSS